MAKNRTPGSRPGLIHCDKCGEEYSSSYRRCPFCADFGEDYANHAASSGGKRLAKSNRRGGGYKKTTLLGGILKALQIILSLAIIAAAAWVVVVKIIPMVQNGEIDDPNTVVSESVSPSPEVSAEVSPDVSPDTSPDVSAEPSPGVSDAPEVTPTPDTTEEPEVTPTPDPTDTAQPGSATSFTLDKAEFAFVDAWPNPITITATLSPAGSTGAITWTSSDPDVASVDANGIVSHGSKRGTATITATLGNGVTQTCTVYNKVSSSLSESGNYTLNKTDFTLYRDYPNFQIVVNGYTNGVTWSSSNTGVATVSSDGTVTAQGSGTCNVTATLADGSTLTAIVRVDFS